MDKKIVFVRTQMGEEEVNGQSDALYGDAKRVLLLIDNKANVAELTKRAPPSLHDTLKNKFQELLNGGYIKDKNTSKNISQPPVLKMASPAYKLVTPKTSVPSQPESSVLLPKMVMPSMPPLDLKNRELEDQSNSTDLDFSFMLPEVGKNKTDVDVPNVRELIEVAAKKRQDLSRSNTGKAAQFEGASKTAKLRSYDKAKEKAKLEVSERARTEAELRKKSEADSIQLKVAQEALKMRTELAEIQVKVEAEVRGRIEAETIIKKKVEAVRLQAERDAEKNRLEIEAFTRKLL